MNNLLKKKIRGWFNKPIIIKLPVCYNVRSNLFIHEVPDWIMSDIKERAVIIIKEDPKLLKRVNKQKVLLVTFQKSVPLGLDLEISHQFYWNGDSLLSVLDDKKVINRDIKIDSLLNN